MQMLSQQSKWSERLERVSECVKCEVAWILSGPFSSVESIANPSKKHSINSQTQRNRPKHRLKHRHKCSVCLVSRRFTIQVSGGNPPFFSISPPDFAEGPPLLGCFLWTIRNFGVVDFGLLRMFGGCCVGGGFAGGRGGLMGWKDPRICCVYDFWVDMFFFFHL